MNFLSPVRRSLLTCLALFLLTLPLHAESRKILVLSPSDTFPASDISSQLQAMLLANGTFTEATVTYRDIFRDGTKATALLGAVYVPPYRSETIAAIQQGGYTHVVMIDRPFFYASAVEFHYEAVNALAKIISAAGAQPVLMMPWVDHTMINFLPVSNANVREYAYRVGDGVRDSFNQPVPVVPAGVAWSSLSSTNRGTVPSQPYNAVALNVNAKYCAAASLYHYLTGANAKSTGYLPAGLTSTVRDAIADHTVSVAASEAVSVRYTGEFQSARLKFWPLPAKIAYSAEGTSTENAIRDQLVKLCADDGVPSQNTLDIFVTNATGSQTPSNLVFARYNFLNAPSAYDNQVPPTTMVTAFDRQYDTVVDGPSGAVWAEAESVSVHFNTASGGGIASLVPYHLLWVKTMYELNIPIDTFNVHATDWQFAAAASALYTMRTNGRNGVYPATAGDVLWSPAIRTNRFAWQTGLMAWKTTHQMSKLQPPPATPDRPFGLDRIIDAEYFRTASRSMETKMHAVETFQINGLREGDWTSYKIDFSTPAPTVITCVASVAAVSGGGEIEVRDGTPTGTLLGTVPVPNTGGANTFQETRGLLTPAGLTGVREIFLVYRMPEGEALALDSFRFSLQARNNESVWIASAGGAWEAGGNWVPTVPEGSGVVARFSLDIPGGLGPDAPITMSGTHTLGHLELGHGAATTGGILLQQQGTALLDLQTSATVATINKYGGSADLIGVPIQAAKPLQINNAAASSALQIQGGITGQRDLFPCGKVNFTGGTYDLGRVGYGKGIAEPFNLPAIVNWNATGTFRNLYLRHHSNWTINGGSITNLGWSDFGNDESGGSALCTLTINGGTYSHASTQFLRLGQHGLSNFFLNLNGGVFETQVPFTKALGNATVTFNGGLFRYTGSADVADLFANGANSEVTTKVGVNGAHFEIPTGRTLSLQNNLTPVGSVDGGVRLTGGGTLVLAEQNNFKGPVVVEEGELRIAGMGSILSSDYTVRSGATFVSPSGVSLSTSASSWRGSGTLHGGLYVYTGTLDLTEGPWIVTQYATLSYPSISLVPVSGQTMIQCGNDFFLDGELTLNIQAPAQAIPAGSTVTLISGVTREGTFSNVVGSNLWAISYTSSAAVLTAQVNIPGVTLAAPNNGSPAVWGNTILLSATANDVVGLSKVEFFASGRKLGEGVEGPAGVFTFSWNLTNEEAQTFAITTRVTSLSGVVLETAPQNLEVTGLTGPTTTWINPTGGNWSTAGNWSGNTVADNFSAAHFDTLDLPAGTTTVTVDAPRTLSKLHLSDIGTGSVGIWRIAGTGGNPLTLSGGAAEVEVISGSAELAAPLISTGFKKTGSGTLTLTTASPGLSGATKAMAGALAIRDSGALGSSTLTLMGGGLVFPSALTTATPLTLATTSAATATFTAPVTFNGAWNQAAGLSTGNLVLLTTSDTATTINMANTIQMPNTDLEIAGMNNTYQFTGNVAVRNFKFYGRGGGNPIVSFAGNSVASCSEKMEVFDTSRTTTIRIMDQAQVTVPNFASTIRCNWELRGGVLNIPKFTVASAGHITFYGGTIRAMAHEPQFITTLSGVVRDVKVNVGGFVLDSNGYNVGVAPNVLSNSSSDGGVIKKGAGTATFTGTGTTNGMTWRGQTNVQGGTLKIVTPGGLSPLTKVFTIAAGAGLDIASSATPTLQLTSSTHSLSGGGTLTGSLAITSGVTNLVAGYPLTVTGTATLAGTLNVSGTLTLPGDYVVLHASSVSGTFSTVTLPAAPVGFSRALVYESNRVLVRVTGPGDAWMAANAPGGTFAEDADGNGWTILQEYALGALPGSSVAGKITMGISGAGKPQVSFGYNTSATDVLIRVESSEDLLTWTTLYSKQVGATTSWTQHLAGAQITTGTTTNGIQQITVTHPDVSTGKSFLRVCVVRAF